MKIARLASTVALVALAVAGCGPSETDARTLWLDVPKDGTVVLSDTQPAPF